MTLDSLAEYYYSACRAFRKIYKWPPQITDDLELRRIVRILEETIEDNQSEKESYGLDGNNIGGVPRL